MKERQEKIIEIIEEFDPRTVYQMLEFLFKGEYRNEVTEKLTLLEDNEFEQGKLLRIRGSSLSVLVLDRDDDFPPTPLLPRDIILQHIKVVAIADYYDIESLRQTAKSYISETFKLKWSSEVFPDIVKAVYEVRDPELHEIICSTVAEHIEDIIQLGDSALEEVVDYNPVGIAKNVAERIRAQDSELKTLRSKLRENDFIIKHLGSSIDKISGTVFGIRQALSERQKCPAKGCKAQFDCFLSENLRVWDCEVRCSLCRCRLLRSRDYFV